jgi:hypothetical protein
MKSKERLIVYPALAVLTILTIINLFKPLPDKLELSNLAIVDTDGKPKIKLSTSNAGGVMRILGPTGNVRVKISTPGDGGAVELFRRIGRRSIWMRAVDDGGLVRVFGYEGKDGIQLSGSDKGGAIAVCNTQGESRAGLMIHDIRGGTIELSGADGKKVKVISP